MIFLYCYLSCANSRCSFVVNPDVEWNHRTQDRGLTDKYQKNTKVLRSIQLLGLVFSVLTLPLGRVSCTFHILILVLI